MPNLYSILGITKTASAEEIKKSYRALAKKYHPDHNKDDQNIAERFKDISAAYRILGDEASRKRYDRGEIDAQGNEQAPPFRSDRNPYGSREYSQSGFGRKKTGRSGFDFEDSEEDVSDFWSFANNFARRNGRKKSNNSDPNRLREKRGLDISYEITIGFELSITGGSHRIKLAGGRDVDIKIPAGIQDGQIIRLSGQGGPGFGGAESGDAMISVHVAPHPYYRREQLDIHLELPISIDEAILGGDIEVPTPRGRLTVRIPAASSSGRRLRLRGKGIKKGNEEGHMYVSLKLMLPTERDAELEKLIKSWSKKGGEALRRSAGFT